MPLPDIKFHSSNKRRPASGGMGNFDVSALVRPQVILALLVIVSLVCTILYVRESESGPLHVLQDTAQAVISPFSAATSTVGNLAVSTTASVEDLTAEDATLNKLRENNATLAQMVVELEEYRQEANRLEELLGLADAYGFEFIASRVVGYEADSYNKVITLDVGSNDGVRVGLPVMGSTGVVGQVISLTPLTSEVRLINDAQSGIAVLLQSSRAEGILTGSVDGTLYLEGISDDVQVKEGDAVITSGLGGGYYRGLVVGTVSKVEQQPGDAQRTIIVNPNADFSSISEVLVVVGMSDESAASSNTSKANSLINAVKPENLKAGGEAAASKSSQSANASSASSNNTQTNNSSDGKGTAQTSDDAQAGEEGGE